MFSEIARLAISHLSKHGFEAFVKYLIEHDDNSHNARQLSVIDERIIECPPERYFQSADAFIIRICCLKIVCAGNLKKKGLTTFSQRFIW